jgi:hypothetical protein
VVLVVLVVRLGAVATVVRVSPRMKVALARAWDIISRMSAFSRVIGARNRQNLRRRCFCPEIRLSQQGMPSIELISFHLVARKRRIAGVFGSISLYSTASGSSAMQFMR